LTAGGPLWRAADGGSRARPEVPGSGGAIDTSRFLAETWGSQGDLVHLT